MLAMFRLHLLAAATLVLQLILHQKHQILHQWQEGDLKLSHQLAGTHQQELLPLCTFPCSSSHSLLHHMLHLKAAYELLLLVCLVYCIRSFFSFFFLFDWVALICLIYLLEKFCQLLSFFFLICVKSLLVLFFINKDIPLMFYEWMATV